MFTVACRECTLPKEEDASQPKGWIQGNTRIGPVLEVTTIYLYGNESRQFSFLGQNFVDSNYNNTEVPADLPEEQVSQSSEKVVAARSKAKAENHTREKMLNYRALFQRKKVD